MTVESVPSHKIIFGGNVRVDSYTEMPAKVQVDETIGRVFSKPNSKPSHYELVTLHHPGNANSYNGLANVMAALCRIVENVTLIFAVSPKNRARLEKIDRPRIDAAGPSMDFRLIESLG